MSTSISKNVTLEKPDDFRQTVADEGIIFTQLDKAVTGRARARFGPLGFWFGLLRD